jgi:hypothetical protein
MLQAAILSCIRQLHRCCLHVADAVHADLVVSEASVQGGAIGGPRQGDAVGGEGLAADVLELGADVVHDALAAGMEGK